MSDDNIHILGNDRSKDTPLAVALKLLEFAKTNDCASIVTFTVVKREDGRLGIIPMASNGTLADMAMVCGCANAIHNSMWQTSMQRTMDNG